VPADGDAQLAEAELDGGSREQQAGRSAPEEEQDELGGATIAADLALEVARRRCLAIISHPDAGKVRPCAPHLPGGQGSLTAQLTPLWQEHAD